MFPLGPPSCSTGIGVAGTDARVISKITGHLVTLTGIGAAPVTAFTWNQVAYRES